MTLKRYTDLKPHKGLVFEAYMSRADIGSGIRLFTIFKVGPKYVYLFYAPRLQAIRLTRTEFRQLHMQPACAPRFNADTYCTNIKRIAADRERLRIVYSKVLVAQVLALTLTCDLGKTS
jgi:hypothetical protein